MNTETQAPLKAELCEMSWQRHRCAFCGGYTEKEPVSAALVDPDEGVVCAACLKVGPSGVGERMLAIASKLENTAAELREDAERPVEMPTYEEWVKANVATGEKIEAELGPDRIPY